MNAETSADAGSLLVRLGGFFDRFDAAFVTFDGAEIAARYAAPYLACRADGSAQSFSDPESISRYFQRVVDDYHSGGVRSCSHSALSIQSLGGRHVLATVNWHLSDSNGAEVSAWRESYVLAERDLDFLIRSSIDHPA